MQPKCGMIIWSLTAMVLFLCGTYPFVCSAHPLNEDIHKHSRVVRYSDFGARGDGVTDDMEAVAKDLYRLINIGE